MYYPPRYLLRRSVILRHLPQPCQAFLEIGPGEFRLSRELADRCTEGDLVEFHPEARARFEAAFPPEARSRVRLHVGDFREMAFGRDFDCVVACEVLEHVEDDAGFIRSMAGVLQPGGVLVLSVPAHMKYWSAHDENVGHLRRYSRAQLTELLSSAGFERVQVLSYGVPLIHLFRFAREGLALLRRNRQRQMSTDERTKRSGIRHLPSMFNWLGLLVNPITFAPLTAVARLFEAGDRSDGYVVVARR